MNTISRALLLHLFVYDSNEGTLLWKNSRWSTNKGKTIKSTHRGYVVVEINGKSFFVHRIIMFLESGKWPVKYTDHINGIKTDNRIGNLRECDSRLNQTNRTYHRTKDRLVGASLDKRTGKWLARAQIDGKRVCFGYFKTELEAHKKYKQELEMRGLL